jgi:hypothetical protein
MHAGWMLHLYPRQWRVRHGAELRAALTAAPVALPDMVVVLAGALDAHLRLERTSPGGRSNTAAAVLDDRRCAGVQALYFAHLSFFTALNIVLLLINLFVTPGTWWFLYPLWGWSIALACHTGLMFPWRGLLGAHAGVSVLLMSGLVAINVQTGGMLWSAWPCVILGALLVTHGLMAFERITLFQAHVVASAIASVVLIFLARIAGQEDLGGFVIGTLLLWIVVLAHWLVRFRGWSLTGAHAALFGGTMAILTVANLTDDSGSWWVRYPLVGWGVILAAHAIVASRNRHLPGETRDDAMLRRLVVRSRGPCGVLHLRSLGGHASALLVGSLALLAISLIDDTAAWWAIWPIGVWLVLLAIHAGQITLPGRGLGLHVSAWLAVSAGLVAIDMTTGGSTWWYWPMMWWGTLVAAHAGALLMPRRLLIGIHLAGGAALVVALALADRITGGATWWYVPAAALVVSLLVHLGLTLDLGAIAAGPTVSREPDRGESPGRF